MAYVTRVRRERVSADELVRRTASVPGLPPQWPSPASATVAGR
ncbi:hypothetical protein [Amycolatopsis sp. lyj-109]